MSIEKAKEHIIAALDRVKVEVNSTVSLISLSSKMDWSVITADDFNSAIDALVIAGHIEKLEAKVIPTVRRLK